MRNSRPGGGGGCKSKTFIPKKFKYILFPCLISSRPGPGGGEGQFPTKNICHKNSFPLFGKKTPDLVLFDQKIPSCLKKNPVFYEKIPKPKSFSKNPRSREKKPTVGTLLLTYLALFWGVYCIAWLLRLCPMREPCECNLWTLVHRGLRSSSQQACFYWLWRF